MTCFGNRKFDFVNYTTVLNSQEFRVFNFFLKLISNSNQYLYYRQKICRNKSIAFHHQLNFNS